MLAHPLEDLHFNRGISTHPRAFLVPLKYCATLKTDVLVKRYYERDVGIKAVTDQSWKEQIQNHLKCPWKMCVIVSSAKRICKLFIKPKLSLYPYQG